MKIKLKINEILIIQMQIYIFTFNRVMDEDDKIKEMNQKLYEGSVHKL